MAAAGIIHRGWARRAAHRTGGQAADAGEGPAEGAAASSRRVGRGGPSGPSAARAEGGEEG